MYFEFIIIYHCEITFLGLFLYYTNSRYLIKRVQFFIAFQYPHLKLANHEQYYDRKRIAYSENVCS